MTTTNAALSDSFTSTENAYHSYMAVVLKPLLQFVTAECLAATPASAPNIVDFVIQLLEANKQRLYQMCRATTPSITNLMQSSRVAPEPSSESPFPAFFPDYLGSDALSQCSNEFNFSAESFTVCAPVLPPLNLSQLPSERATLATLVQKQYLDAEAEAKDLMRILHKHCILSMRIPWQQWHSLPLPPHGVQSSAFPPQTPHVVISPNAVAGQSASTVTNPPAVSGVTSVQSPSPDTFSSTHDALSKCCSAVVSGTRRRDSQFPREIFERYQDGTGRLPATKLIAALTEADAPVIPDSDAAAAATIARFDCNNNGLMEFSEFERAMHLPDELALYFQEKQMPTLADALRALVGRGSDQLLRVSQLPPGDMHAASAAVCASIADEAKSLHEELRRSFDAQFEIQAQMDADAGKFNVVKMACGSIVDFHSGLAGRVGMPHLKFKDAMRQEHCEKAGCTTPFTTGNYKITTTPKQEWLYIAGGDTGDLVPCADMGHGRRIVLISELMQLKLAIDAKLTEVELLAVVLYTGPMFQSLSIVQVYNCILRRFPAEKYALFDQGGNRYATTIFVLVSAVQKISRCTKIPEGTLLYRGLGGLIDLPDKFHEVDAQGRSGYLDWGMMSTSSDRNVALGYSGVKQRRPRAMVMVIEATSVDRGADISAFSQYPGEKEFLWVPCSFVQRVHPGGGRVQVIDGGLVTFVPVRVNLNLKTETVEELLEKKKSMHITGFEFRVNELLQKLHEEATACNAQARLKRDKDDQGVFWEKQYSVEGYIDAQVKKVEAVLEQHRARAAADYSDDAVYRSLVAESLEVANMAHSALRLWLRDEQQTIDLIEDASLLELHRFFESFLRLRYASATNQEQRCAAAVELCKARNLMSLDANERDGNGEPLLVALAARGGSGEDVTLLIAARADVFAVAVGSRCAMYFAAQQGHVEAIKALVHARADCNQPDMQGQKPLYICSFHGHLGSVNALLEAGAHVNKAAADNGATPLYVASQFGHSSIVEALVGRRAHVNKAGTKDGATPLFVACQNGHTSCVELLLRARADPTVICNRVTSLDIATRKGHVGIASIIQAAAAAEHAAAFEQHRAAGSVVVTRHRGGGCVTSGYLLHFQDFNTFVADVRLCCGCFYFELQVGDIVLPQFGFCTQGFEPREDAQGEGAGDDAWSWVVDGARLKKWHQSQGEDYGSAWAVGDVIGFALDMRTAGAAVMSVSVNGSFAVPNGHAFTSIDAPYLSPAFTGLGRYRVNFGDRPFVHAPPDGNYMSVHDFHRQLQ